MPEPRYERRVRSAVSSSCPRGTWHVAGRRSTGGALFANGTIRGFTRCSSQRPGAALNALKCARNDRLRFSATFRHSLWLTCATLLALETAGAPVRGQGQPPLPERLDSYIKSYVKLTSEEQTRLLAGEPVTRLLDADPSKEVAIFGAVWVNAPIARYVSAVSDIESFETGDNFLVTKRISNPPRLEDFDKLTLPPDDISDLKTCEVGDCELKLGASALTRIQQETDWSKPTAAADVERAVRKLAARVRHRVSGGRKQPVGAVS